MTRNDLHIPDMNPDFREMSVKDLRNGMSELNRAIKKLKDDGDGYQALTRDLVSLRQKFKAVWRARPGRPVFDVEGRRQREQLRRRYEGGGGFLFPFGM